MKHFSPKPFVLFASIVAMCITFKIGTYDVKADTSIKDQPEAVVKSASLTSKKLIKVPTRQVATTATSTTSKSKKVTTNRGGSGLQESAPSGSSSIAAYAYKFLGKPYIWGASGPRAFDCSGFTSYIYKAFGVSLPHNAASQFGRGQSVSRGSLSSGDLVFFNTSGGISHVGLYIGGGRFIHAANSRKGVIVSSLNEGYYSDRFVGAKRMR